MSEIKQKFFGIDVVRGVATCLVASAHASWRIAEPRNFGTVPFHGLLDGLFVSVDFFFVLSGFLIAWVHWKDIGNPARVGNYCKRRFSRIYPVYWIVLTLVILGHVFHPSVSNPQEMTWKLIVTSYIIIPNDGPTILGVAWTLYYEIFGYIMFAILLCIGRLGFVALFAWSLIIIGYYLFDYPQVFPFNFILNAFILQFYLGIAAAAYLKNYTVPFPKVVASVGIVLFFTIVFLNPAHLFNNNFLVVRCVFGVIACAVIGGLIEAERSGNLTIPVWLRNFGAGAYSIYLVHTIVQPIILQYGAVPLKMLTPEGGTIVLAAMSIYIGYVFHRIVELPVTALVQRLVMGANAPRVRAMTNIESAPHQNHSPAETAAR